MATKKGPPNQAPESEGTNELTREILGRLREPLSPTSIKIFDDTADHAGHAGNQHQQAYLRLYVVSDAFEGLSRLQRHQWIMSLVKDLVGTKIHALTLELKAPSEVAL